MTEALDLDEIEYAEEPSFEFKLAGQTFRCRQKDDVHWDTIENWMQARAAGGASGIVVQLDEFFEAVLFPEDFEAFAAIKHDRRGALTQRRAMALLQGISKEVFGVAGVDPTERRSSSRAGSSRTGSTSKAKSRGRVTPKASAA